MPLDDLVPPQFKAAPDPIGERVGLNKAEQFLADFVEDKPTLQSILQTVGRPLSAIANVAEAGVLGVQGKGGEALERLKGAGRQAVDFGGDILELVPSAIDAVLPGDVIPSDVIPNVTTPDDFRSFVNVLETAGVPRGPVFDLPVIGKVSARGLAGFGLDIPLDPLNIGAGKIAAATGPAVRGVGRFLATKTPLRALTTGSHITGPATNRALRISGEAQRATQEALVNVWDEARVAATAAGVSEDVAPLRFMRAVERKGALPEDAGARKAAIAEIKRRVGEYRAQGLNPREAARAAFIATTTGEELMAPFAGQAQTVLRDILLTEQRAGVSVSALRDPALNYLSRVLTPEAWEAMNSGGRTIVEQFRKEFAKWTARHGSTKARKAIHGGTMIPDLNAIIKQQLGKGFKFKLFSEDPAHIAAVRSRRMGQGLKASEFYQSVIRDFAEDVPHFGSIAVDDLLKSKGLTPGAGPFAASGGKFLPREVADAVLRTMDSWNDPATPKGVLGIFVRATDHFKSWVTAPFPAFHFRNWVSNMWANYLGGVKNPKRYIDAIEVGRDMARGGGNVWKQYGGLTSKQIIDTMGDSHALGFGSTSASEFASIATHPAKSFFGPLVKGKLVKAGRKAGELIEDNAKIAHVLDRLRKGDTLDTAILSAKKYLFDYSELSPIEKRLFRRIVPFYTFARKNIPLQLESLFTKPGKVATLDKFQRLIQNRDTGDEGVDTSVIPHWLRKTVFGTERMDDGSMRIISGLGVGFEELSIFDRPFDEFASMMNPIIKGPLQQAMNTDFFRGVPLDKSDVSPNLSWFKHVPGGQLFLDSIDFRPAADGRFYRANPIFLNAVFGTLAPGTSRAAFQLTSLMNESAENTGRPEAGLRAVTGFRRSTMSVTRQMQENQRRMLERYIERMEELQREGVTFEIEDRFAIRRDIARDDPRRTEARKINRDLARAKRALSRLSRTERAAMAREGLRSGGR